MKKDLQSIYGNDEERTKIAFQTSDVEVLKDLATDECLAVRLEVAGNENSTSEVLSILAVDPNSGVRLQVAGNVNANKSVIGILLEDDNQSVREEASYSEFAPK